MNLSRYDISEVEEVGEVDRDDMPDDFGEYDEVEDSRVFGRISGIFPANEDDENND